MVHDRYSLMKGHGMRQGLGKKGIHFKAKETPHQHCSTPTNDSKKDQTYETRPFLSDFSKIPEILVDEADILV